MASEGTVRVELVHDEKYPWLILEEPEKWAGTDLDRPWIELPVEVVERYRAACDEWEEACAAVEAAAEDAPRGGTPSLAALIAKEHGLRPVPKESAVVPTDALLGVLAWAAEADHMTEEGRADLAIAAEAAGLQPETLTMYRLMRPPRG